MILPKGWEEYVKTPEVARSYLAATRKYVLIALDYDNIDKAIEVVKEFGPYVAGFKIGHEMQAVFQISTRSEKELTDLIRSFGGVIFFDGKYLDIKNTEEKTEKIIIGNLLPGLYNIHATASGQTIAAVVANRSDANILLVTILTDISDEECLEIFKVGRADAVLMLTRRALRYGAQGVVSSGEELIMFMQYPEFESLIKVIPAVRPKWAAANDQKAIVTPAIVVMNNGTYMVIGRPITSPPKEIGSSLNALLLIGKEIHETERAQLSHLAASLGIKF